MTIKEIIIFTLPLLLTGLLHHFLIVRYNLFPILRYPLDANLTINGKRILGNHKTWRGLLTFVLLTGLFTQLLLIFYNLSLTYPSFIAGNLLGLGYALGELPNSYLKRKFNIKEGQTSPHKIKYFFAILDQTDSIIGTIIFLYLVYSPSPQLILTLFLTGTILHIIVDLLLHRFGYKKKLTNP